MRLKSIITLIAIFVFVFALSVGGCGRGGDQAQPALDTRSANVAPSDFKPDAVGGAKAESQTASADPNKAETNSIADKGGEGVDLAEREEIRRSYTIKPGADIIVSGINGRVDVETAETDHAEVLIVRSAKTREDLQFRKIKIEHDPSELQIRIEDDRRSFFSAFGSIPEGRQRVILKLPRKIAFTTNGVNGDVAVGEIEGGVAVRGLNGKINIAQATGGATFRGVTGKIDATIAWLSTSIAIDAKGVKPVTGGGTDTKGVKPPISGEPDMKRVTLQKGAEIDINGVNGDTTLRFIGEVNADVEARGHTGKVESDLPNLQENKDEKRYGHYNARIGTGGPRIRIRGVIGDVFLMKAEKPNATATVSAK